ncbi:MAG: glutamate racemase [Chthonomonadales bacterium]
MTRSNGADGDTRGQTQGTAMEQRLIGVFDSGVGGLTVAHSILRVLPGYTMVYVADQAHVPYGGRPLADVRGFALGISRFLAARGCGAIVMACNISSAVALEGARTALAPTPVLGVIDAAVARVAQHGGEAVGILATEGTVRSDVYRSRIAAALPGAEVVQVACPRFVPLVEAGDFEGEEAEDAARAYLEPLAARRCRVVVLGCTHYPFLLGVLRRVAADLFVEEPIFVDPAEELTEELGRLFDGAASPAARHHTMLTTGDPAAFRRQLDRFLPGVPVEIGRLEWRRGELTGGALQTPSPAARIKR